MPEPVGPVIKSGDKVPCDGIWEPVAVERSRLLGMVPVGNRSLRGSGCFNYFIRDIRAPGLRNHESRTVVQTHWRLLWEDKRYSDGTIPDESQYFLGQSSVSQSDVAAVTPVQIGDR